LSETADAPYDNVLVIFLYSDFDMRRNLETEVVNSLSDMGIRATASTSMMDTRTPVTRETFLDMVEAIDADAVLVTQLVYLQTEVKMTDMRPEATYNVTPTYFYNVFNVDLQEYVESQAPDYEHDLNLGTQLYSAQSKDVVWAIESRSRIHPRLGDFASYSIYVDEAKAITRRMSRDGLLER